MRPKHVFPIVLGIVLLSVSATTALADPLSSGNSVAVGDQYTITTNSGHARAWIDGLALYSFVMWVYVISFQIVVPESVYWPLALWLPIRMDYFGEASLVSSFIFAVLWVKLR